ncbi:MAG: exopolyphosphatase [Flavobacteriia bacterium]|jgi:exopolyphosphatase/guanosine-5'-triphosphate,3'-diphosphate pyrophosphatase|nr:ethanolamine ammonia-lyase reactivating factor EutA [Cryomorphaceae bacterium]
MKFGAIDIGTNAARLLVGEVDKNNRRLYVKKVSYTRIPLRLGEDVFDEGSISKKKANDFVKTIQAFRLISEIFDVHSLRAVATSAMREAKNADKIIEKIQKETGVTIEIISGQEEADLIFGNFEVLDIDQDIPFIVIDVGGGSTEVSIFENGHLISSRSFEIGTLRALKGKVEQHVWTTLHDWIDENVDMSRPHQIFGTGGNINKIHKILGAKQNESISVVDIQSLHDQLEPLSIKKRVELLQLKPDRADVIIPAMEIYLFILKQLGCDELFVPKVGLSDGMILKMHEESRG